VSDLDRRDFLKRALATGAGLGALAGGADVARADGEGGDDATPSEKVPRRQLGATGQTVPILLVGCAQAFNPRYDRILHRAYQEGVDYLDTALVYAGGRSHTTIAPFVKQVGEREKLWITSKAPHRKNRAGPDSFERDLTKCLEQLEIDYLDLFFMHALNDAKYLEPEFIKMGEKLKSEGKTKFFGFSCHDGNVVELLNKAAEIGAPGIDAIMFRYSFADYGDAELNRAIDACVERGVGLIAMKTQKGLGVNRNDVQAFMSKDFNEYQAKLKAVWADERISAAVSHMDNVEKLNENIAAAKSPIRVSMNDLHQLMRRARCSPHLCTGCTHICESRIDGETKVADALRFLMYHEAYGEPEKARELYQLLTPAERALEGIDFAAATKACPAGIDIPARLERARELLG
jgi:predicted aldo/keto reductase-like oxidoreductase